VPPLSHLTSWTTTKSNVYLTNSLATAVSDPGLYRLLTFHLPNLKSLFHCLWCTKWPIQVRGFMKCFVTCSVLQWKVLSTSPNTRAGGPPLVGCPRLLIQHIRSCPPHLEAVPCSATWGHVLLWWQAPNYCGHVDMTSSKFRRHTHTPPSSFRSE
jgi:hypothetical protein